MGMTREEMLKKLEAIAERIGAKGHPMQDYSTLKLALIDLIDIMKNMAEKPGEAK